MVYLKIFKNSFIEIWFIHHPIHPLKVYSWMVFYIYIYFYFLFYYKFIYFNWRLIALQYCIGFAIINMNPPRVCACSPSWTPLPPPFPYHPSGSFQCTSPKHPVSCIEAGLAIRFIYDIIHVLMPFSQIIPPLPSPTESKRLFYTSWRFFF